MCALLTLQVPEKIFITDKLPKTATGKIQRRMMVGHFMGETSKGQDAGLKKNPTASTAGKQGSPVTLSKL